MTGLRLFILVGPQCPASLRNSRSGRCAVVNFHVLDTIDERPNEEQDGVRVKYASPIVLVERCFAARGLAERRSRRGAKVGVDCSIHTRSEGLDSRQCNYRGYHDAGCTRCSGV